MYNTVSQIFQIPIILDTCALLWLADDQDRLTPRQKKAIGTNRGSLFVSAITAFEIGLRHKKKRLGLPLAPEVWYERVLDLHGIRELPISGPVLLRAVSLPDIHSDPCDRFIIAAALEMGCPVVTADRTFRKYTGLKVV
jgi:PIN domain nuclease of toxin-antitoxin system